MLSYQPGEPECPFNQRIPSFALKRSPMHYINTDALIVFTAPLYQIVMGLQTSLLFYRSNIQPCSLTTAAITIKCPGKSVQLLTIDIAAASVTAVSHQ